MTTPLTSRVSRPLPVKSHRAIALSQQKKALKVELHGQEPVASEVRRKPPKLQSSFVKVLASPKPTAAHGSKDTCILPQPGDRGLLRRRVKNILVPVDFSDNCKKALDYALAFAKKTGARIYLLHALPELTGGRFLPDFQFSRLANDQLQQFKKREIPSNLNAQAILRHGAPYKEIIRCARELKIDLIIMTTHGYTGLSHVLIGSVAERVLRHALCPVLIIPKKNSLKRIRFQKILVPTDFSKQSQEALEYALLYAKEFKSKIHILHVVEPPLYPDNNFYNLKSQSEAMMKAAKIQIKTLRTSLGRMLPWIQSICLKTGIAFQKTVNEAEKKKMDMIVISTHGYTGLYHFLLGSNTEKIVRHAHCPILVVRKPGKIASNRD